MGCGNSKASDVLVAGDEAAPPRQPAPSKKPCASALAASADAEKSRHGAPEPEGAAEPEAGSATGSAAATAPLSIKAASDLEDAERTPLSRLRSRSVSFDGRRASADAPAEEGATTPSLATRMKQYELQARLSEAELPSDRTRSDRTPSLEAAMAGSAKSRLAQYQAASIAPSESPPRVRKTPSAEAIKNQAGIGERTKQFKDALVTDVEKTPASPDKPAGKPKGVEGPGLDLRGEGGGELKAALAQLEGAAGGELSWANLTENRQFRHMSQAQKSGALGQLARATALRHVVLDKLALDNQNAGALGALVKCGTLEHLSLEGNAVGEPGMLLIAKSLRAHPTLRELSVANQRDPISSVAAHAFVDSMEDTPPLLHLRLGQAPACTTRHAPARQQHARAPERSIAICCYTSMRCDAMLCYAMRCGARSCATRCCSSASRRRAS